ncbi:MAG: thioredoxin family protein [Bacteroidetes bacterium]|nr:thioredoxin family protein [Bacteroidota bacterium]
MKYATYIVCASLLILVSCSPKNALMVTKDKDGSKMLMGTTTRASLTDPAFPWFKKGYDAYKPAASPLKLIKASAPVLHIEVFGGTWCDDTHELLPKFYKVADAVKISDSQITLHLVGRDKTTKDGSSAKYKIVNVPTYVVIKNGVEIGRIVESVKTSIEADLAAILTDKD